MVDKDYAMARWTRRCGAVLFAAALIGCAGRDAEPARTSSPGLGLDVGKRPEPTPRAPTQHLDFTVSDAGPGASAAGQPRRTKVGSFDVCGGNCTTPGTTGVSPLVAPTKDVKPPAMLDSR